MMSHWAALAFAETGRIRNVQYL